MHHQRHNHSVLCTSHQHVPVYCQWRGYNCVAGLRHRRAFDACRVSCVRSPPLDCRVRQVAAASSSRTTGGGGVEETKSAPPRPAAPSGASSLPKSAASSSAAAPKSVRKQSNFLLSKHIQEVCLHCATRGALCCLTCAPWTRLVCLETWARRCTEASVAVSAF